MRFLALLFASALCFAPGNAKPKASPPAPSSDKSRIAFVVNKDAITQAALDSRLKLAAVSSGMALTPEDLERIRPQIQNALINETLQLQEAKKDKIEIDQKQIDEAIANLEDSSGMGKGAVAKLMTENKIPRGVLEDQVRAHLSWMEVIRTRHAGSFQLSDWEVDQELQRQQENKNKQQFHLAEIVLAAETPQQEQEAIATFNKLVGNLENGAHWGALAQQFSQAATAAQGGDMGWVTEDALPNEVKEMLTHMTPGNISTPFKVGNTYMLLAMIDQKGPGQTGKVFVSFTQGFIPYPFFASDGEKQATFAKAKKISSSGSCPAMESALKGIPEAESKSSGRMPLNQMDPEIAGTLAGLKAGQSVDPFKTPDGVMVLMLCEREEEKEKEWTRDEAFQTLAGRRMELLARRELRDVRRSAFIDVRI